MGSEKGKRAHPVVSLRLDDGTLVETLFRSASGETLLVCRREGRVFEAKRLRLPDGTLIAPYSPQNNLLSHRVILLPEEASPYQSETDLLASVRAFIHRYVDLSEAFEEIAAYYVLFSWLYDDFADLPYLRVRGDYGSGKSRFLQTIGSLCYKPIFASGASTVSPLFRIIDAVKGTLVIDEADFRVSDEKAEIVKILNNGNARGFPVLRSEITPKQEINPRAFDVFGPKLIATRRDFEDPALESRCLSEDMGTRALRRDIPLNLPKRFAEEATGLRNQLLSFRLRHAGKERSLSSLSLDSLEPRIAQVISPLLSVVETAAGKERLLQLAKSLSGESASRRRFSLSGEVLEVIWRLREDGQTLAVGRIARDLETRLGETFSPRLIGSILRRELLVKPTKRQGSFVIPESEQGKLDVLFSRYGLGVDVGDEGDVPGSAPKEVER